MSSFSSAIHPDRPTQVWAQQDHHNLRSRSKRQRKTSSNLPAFHPDARHAIVNMSITKQCHLRTSMSRTCESDFEVSTPPTTVVPSSKSIIKPKARLFFREAVFVHSDGCLSKKNCIGLRYLYQSTLYNRFDITNCCQSTIHVQQSTMNINININTRIIKSKTTMGSNCNKKHQLQPKWLLEEVKVYFS